MTTIATDGFTIAADSRGSYGDEWGGDDCDKIRCRDGYIFAFSGPLAIFDPLIDWFFSGRCSDKLPKTDRTWGFLHVDPDGVIHYTANGTPYPERVTPPFTFGAGQSYALGVLDYGGTPEDAVRVAAKRNYHTGGRIKSVDIAKELGRMAREKADVAIAAE